MSLGVLLCSIVGHKWRVAEATTDPQARIKCQRCGRVQLAPDGTAYQRRVEMKASRLTKR
jgi:Pyruvate/2-oxoacid:ferredoxin oxidoreductase delta subunit